jgi:hypothetical protein
LNFQSQDGWEPQRRFLRKDVPEEPYPPRVNDGNIVVKLVAQDGVLVAAGTVLAKALERDGGSSGSTDRCVVVVYAEKMTGRRAEF